jgi:hypothetical protein
LVGHFAKANAADAEFAVDGAGPATNLASPFTADGKFGLAIRLGNF